MIGALIRRFFTVWEFKWSELKWVCIGPPNTETFHATIRVGNNKTFEVWTHDNHKTYNIMVYGPGSRHSNCVGLANYIPAFEANCICIEWFKNNRP